MARTKKSVDDARRARLMRHTKTELVAMVMDLGLEVMDLESQVEELQPVGWIGEVEKSTRDLCRSVEDPSEHHRVLMAAAIKLARLLDEPADEIGSAAAGIEKQLLATCALIAAKAEAGEQAGGGLFAVPDVG